MGAGSADSDHSDEAPATHRRMAGAGSATISPVRTDFSRLSDAACVLCALRSTLLSSQEVAARSAYARSKPG
ncbi:hypothetical protein MyNCGM683_36410 [Achromobacter xylosoxidans]